MCENEVKLNYLGISSIENSLPPQPPKQRHQANARERYRTYSVNSAFTTLRQLIPTEPENRKLSKIEILRLAKSYIEHLGATLLTENSQQPCLHKTNFNYQEKDQCNVQRNRSSICTFCISNKSVNL